MNEIKLIIFDFDGTLGDTQLTIVKTLQATMKKFGWPVASDEACAATIGLPLYMSFMKLCEGITEEQANACAESYHGTFLANKKAFLPALFPNVTETLKMLAAHNYEMTIASSRNNESLTDFVNELGLRDYIKFIIGADDVTKAKPDPEPVLKTLQTLDYAPHETLVVGDMSYDIMMGARAGAKTCGVTYGNGTKEQLADCGANFIIDDMADLLQVVGL